MLELLVAYGAILVGVSTLPADEVQSTASSAKEPSVPKGVPLDPSLFARVIDALGDVEPRIVKVARLEAPPSSVKVEAMPSPPGVRMVPGPSQGSWQLLGDTGIGAPVVLGCLETSGLDLTWSWRRNSASKMADSLAKADQLLDGLRLTLSFPDRPPRVFEVAPRAAAPKVEPPVALTPAPSTGCLSEALLARAIRVAEDDHQAEATAYSKKVTEQAKQQLRAKQKAEDEARDKRNSTKADDRHGRSGNGVSNRDDNYDERLRGRGRPDGPKYAAPSSWADVMRDEVESERKRDPQSAKKDGRPLYPDSHPLAGPQLEKFVRKYRGKISDARIKAMIEKVTAEYRLLVAAPTQAASPAPALLPDAKAPLPERPLKDPTQKAAPAVPSGR